MLKLDSQVSLGEPEAGTLILVSARPDSKPLRLRGHSVHLARRLQAGCGEQDLVDNLKALTGSTIPLQATVAAFVAQLRGAGMIEGSALPSHGDVRSSKGRRMSFPNPDRVVRPIGEWLGRIPLWAHLIMWTSIVSASVLVLSIATSRNVLPSVFSLNLPSGLFGLLLLPGWIVLHETAHAIACRAVGCPVSGAGLIIRRFALPSFYVDTKALYLLRERAPKVVVALAGPFVDFTYVCVLVASLMWGELGEVATASVQLAVYCVMFSLFFNLSPFRRSDGSNALSSALGDPFLPLRAFSRNAAVSGDRVAVRTYRAASAAYCLVALLLLAHVFQLSYMALKPKVEVLLTNQQSAVNPPDFRHDN